MKVFISFLGAIRYEETRYYFDKKEDASSPTYYVQEAILDKQLLGSWGSDDKIYIFTTDDAYQNNFVKRIVKYDSVSQKSDFSPLNDGLGSVLQHYLDSGKIEHFEAVRIENGNSVAEIWQVFQTVYDKLKNVPDCSDIFFDITFGFRSLPMLGIVLLNYVKTLHNHTIRYIYYGNYEVGRQEKQNRISEAVQNKCSDEVIASLKSSMPCSPVLDLRPFVELQDWTTAAQAFLKGGNAHFLSDLIKTSNADLANNLTDFTQAILTCRGKMLTQDLDINSFKSLVSLSNEITYEKQLTPILERIEHKVNQFNSQNIKNGFSAVEWCIENGLIQQGYTFLLETIISYVVEATNGISYVNDFVHRDCAAAALQGFPDIRNNGTPQTPNIVANMRGFVNSKHNLSTTYKSLTGHRGLRNDINHCGYKDNYALPQRLKEDLRTVYNSIKQILSLS